jgi:hypothetical protein
MTKLERGVFRQQVDDDQVSLHRMTRAERSQIPAQEAIHKFPFKVLASTAANPEMALSMSDGYDNCREV